MNEDVRCPNPACPLPDDVQKLSVVAHGGPPQRFETFTAGADSETNNWSDQLAAPPPPRKDHDGDVWYLVRSWWPSSVYVAL